MATMSKNEYGVISVAGSAITRMIVDNLLSFEDTLLPCNRKGKLLRKGIFTGNHELGNSVEIREKSEGIHVDIFAVAAVHGTLAGASQQLFSMVEEDFGVLCLEKPAEIRMNIMGFLPEGGKQPVGRRYTLRRRNVREKE
ncbi:hypothetical protein ACTQ4Z_06835 [Anaerovoracaceae bacterium Sow4_D4]|nr:hypothetical protein [uncultured Mogibacterium sp.]